MPERRAEITTEGGLDVTGQEAALQRACARLAQAGIRVSLFIDPEATQLEAAVHNVSLAFEMVDQYLSRIGG